VPSLQLPDSGMAVEDLVVTEAVRLFIGRAEKAQSTFALSETNAPAIGELCRRLDGIPLAIELAAARVRVMTLKEILDHLDRRFKLLTAGRRTAVTRHQTLQSTLDWSHDLLEEPEKVVFRRLSVFAGDFDRSMAEAVVADDRLDSFEVSDALFKLVDKSLVVAQPGSELTRYRMLETIRDYAWERLSDAGETDQLSGRHCRQVLVLAEELEPQLCDAREMEARARIEQELDNLRAGLRWAVDAGEAEMALRLVDALSNSGSLRSPFGTLPVEVAMMPRAEQHPLRAVALATAAAALEAHGNHEEAIALADAALDLAGDAPPSPVGDRVRCHLFGNVAMVSHIQQDLAGFTELSRSWLASARRIDDPFQVSQALNLLGNLLIDPAEGLEACESALVIARELGSPSRIAFVSLVIGARLSEIDVDRAEAAFAEGLEAARIARNDWVDTFSGTQLAFLQTRKGDLPLAASTLVDVAETAERKGDHFAIAMSLIYLAAVLANLGDGETAILLAAWSESRSASVDASHPTFAGQAGELVALRDGQTESERLDSTERAAAFDTAEIVALARRQVDQLR
jgi:tetratricopeptide (TPR) repeat protein